MAIARRSKTSQVNEVLDYTIANPKESFDTISVLFDLGAGTLTNWIKPRSIKGKESNQANVHPAVQKWMKDHGPEWMEMRPRNHLGPAVLKIANKAVRTRGVSQADPLTSGLEPIKAKPKTVEEDLSISANSITPKPKTEVVFQPKTSGDLVVLETEVEDMLRRAVATVHHLESVLTSIKITVEWTREVDGRLTAEKKVRELENQVSLADKAAKEAQTQMLSNKMIEKFGSR